MRAPSCPRCKCNRVSRCTDGTLRCSKCGAWFDDDPDEGGDYGDRPEYRMQRQEQRKPE